MFFKKREKTVLFICPKTDVKTSINVNKICCMTLNSTKILIYLDNNDINSQIFESESEAIRVYDLINKLIDNG